MEKLEFRFFCYVANKLRKTHRDLLSHIVDDDDAVSSSVIAGGDSSKPLLTCCVPLRKNTPHTHTQTDDILCPNCAGTLTLKNSLLITPGKKNSYNL